jgi:ketosteroid isomerase-like protein
MIIEKWQLFILGEVIGLEFGGLKSIIHNICEAFNKKDLTRMISFFADDAIIIRPEGTFRGKEEIKRYYTWSFSNYSELTLTEKDFIVEGNKVVLEFVSEGTSVRGGGKKQRALGLVVFEFRNGKVQQVHDYYDRLLIAQQLANGWFEKKIINAVVNRTGKGLR